jgi:hypothetical protein
MIPVDMPYGPLFGEYVARWTSANVHVGLPCETAAMAFVQFCGTIHPNVIRRKHSTQRNPSRSSTPALRYLAAARVWPTAIGK